MSASSGRTRLVALSRSPQRLLAGLRGTTGLAVDLAAVAAAADDHLGAAVAAQEQTARSHVRLPAVADKTWTNALIGRILVLAFVPGTVWGTAPRQNC